MKIWISGGLYASVLVVTQFIMQYVMLPRVLLESAGQEAWITVLILGVYALVVALAVVWIACRFPDRDPLKAIRCTLGSWATYPIVLLYCAFNVLIYAMSLSDVQTFTKILLLPDTPAWVLAVMIALFTIYTVLQGVEPIARTAYGVLVPLVLVILVLPFGVGKEIRLLQIDPFLWKGFSGVLRGAWLALPGAGQSLIVLSLMRHLSLRVNPYKWTLIGVGSAHLALAIMVLLISLVFGSILPSRLLYPGHELFAIVALTESIERIQAGIMVLWLCGSLINIALHLYVAVEEGSLALGIQRRGWITLILGAAGVFLAQWAGGALYRRSIAREAWWIGMHIAGQLAVLALLGLATLLIRMRQGAGTSA
ncbi:MAG: hypothetical protein A6D92_00135 [Symbiobacterium thermophilum]|uniref:Spore germination protein n=1 Tax=Symbiobacterium thermophilum TaxID=2734 RepID=A0A1Y2T978_SYMTR|nr:MAG: hypothetical protein A6D92_00135 [Symbiobacterium thermophilum]